MEAMEDLRTGVSVFVVNGKHKGWAGNVSHVTPKKCVIKTHDGKISGYIDRSHVKFDLDDDDEEEKAPVESIKKSKIKSPEKVEEPVEGSNEETATVPSFGESESFQGALTRAGTYEETHVLDYSLMAVSVWLSFELFLHEGTGIVAFFSHNFYPFLAAVCVYFSFNIGALPARVRMTVAEWRLATGYRVIAGYCVYQGLIFMQKSKGDADLRLRTAWSIFLLFILAPLCYTAYCGMIQCRPERHAAQLAVNCIALTALGYHLAAEDMKDFILTSCVSCDFEKLNFGVAGAFCVLKMVVLAGLMHSMLFSCFRSYLAIKETYKNVPHSGW